MVSRPQQISDTHLREMHARAEWAIACGSRYWPFGTKTHIQALDLPEVSWTPSRTCMLVPVPEWAADIAVGSTPSLLVDRASITAGDGSVFERCNWLCAAYLFLSGAQEHPGEAVSYASLLPQVDARIFDHAWVNRIFLLLRRLAARRAQVPESKLFGERLAAKIRVTHDVDAIRKMPEIRFKQTAFHLYNAARAASTGRWSLAAKKLERAARFLGTTPNYWNFPMIRKAEADRGIRSTFNFYGGPPGWRRASFRKMLMDPGYDVNADDIRRELGCLRDGGWSIGLHPSFECWDDAVLMRREREAVERACGAPVSECRQHWLRFSWTKTWRTQIDAGLSLDTTLGFNDRPGFRNGTALRFRPWDEDTGRALAIEAIPMILMDSHFYDYAAPTDDERRPALARWIGEVRAVGGQASVNWHVHTLAPDYGWAPGYIDLLDALA